MDEPQSLEEDAMLKHRVSNAGSHPPPQTINRTAPTPSANQQTIPPVKVPKPPRLHPDSIQHTTLQNADYCDSSSVPLNRNDPRVCSMPNYDNTGINHANTTQGHIVQTQQPMVSYEQSHNHMPPPPPPPADVDVAVYKGNICLHHYQQQPAAYDDQPHYPPPPPPPVDDDDLPPPSPPQFTLNGNETGTNYSPAYNQNPYQQSQIQVNDGQQIQQMQNIGVPVPNHSVPISDSGSNSDIETMKAKEGMRVINEKYDSPGNMSTSPQRSPLTSPTTSAAPVSITDILMSQKFREGVTEQDLLQVDTFYRGHKTDVYVCNCLANMYVGNVKSLQSTEEQWNFIATGIPLLLLDTGEHHRQRKLFLILAEKGTGFTLWRDVIDNMTNYKTPNANFHTMHTSKDHTKLAGFSFDEADKAREFYTHLQTLTSDPSDDLLKIGKGKKKKSVKEKKKKLKLPKKNEISQPCCFVHVTKLERPTPDIEDAGKLTPDDKRSPETNGISAPFNFQHVTGTGNGMIPKSESLSNVMGSKLTLNSSSSVDSGLSDDRSTRTANS